MVALAHSLGAKITLLPTGHITVAERQQEQQRTELRRHAIALLICVVFVVPVLVVDMVLPIYPATNARLNVPLYALSSGVDTACLVIFVCASVIQFGVGLRFYVKAYRSLRSGLRSVGMDFLVSTGTSAAYLFALVGFVRALVTGVPRDNDVSYAETSAVLITVVLLGKFL